MTKKIPLQNGMFAIVDEEDYERCMEFSWTIPKSNSAHMKVKGKNVQLTRFILNNENDKDIYVTFINKDRLDYRKTNLTIVDRLSLNRRRKGDSGSSSNYKGVSMRKSSGRWRARIFVKGKEVALGTFESEREAALAYNVASTEYFGVDSYQNVIDSDNNASFISLEKTPQPRTSKNILKKYRGVHKNHGRFLAKVGKNGENVHVGNYKTELEAAIAYDEKAYELYGDNAILNFPDEVVVS